MLSKLVPAAALAAAAVLSMPALAHEVVYVGTLSGAAEAPPNASPGTGPVRLTFDDHLNTMRLEFSFSGLLGTLTAAHIHGPTVDPMAGTAGVMTRTPTFTGTPLGVSAGSFDQTIDMTQAASWNASFLNAAPRNGDTALAFATLMTAVADGKAYLNLHSSVIGSGEVRTFFTLAPVPEPSSYALMAAGLGLLAAVARQRRRV